ncbi:hypothetical protein GCK32_017777 [Trichostrongylus colubriformis]|uniref:Uncharacterized protein n=1 Tax=Trichostrongylus colubriformis TaxID=6319 RepID=A0AAN8IU75_TRICO
MGVVRTSTPVSDKTFDLTSNFHGVSIIRSEEYSAREESRALEEQTTGEVNRTTMRAFEFQSSWESASSSPTDNMLCALM